MLMLHLLIPIAILRTPFTYANGTNDHGPGRCERGLTFKDSKLHCTSGCQTGWTGPGCQIGNILAGTSCHQSSTYCPYDQRASDGRCSLQATNAVDGQLPLNTDETYCSQTDMQAYPWWYATFNGTRQHVIQTITITNRIGNYSGRLHDFYVLVTNSTNGSPHPSNWSACAYHPGEPPYNSTFNCSGAIGRRVAVYLNSSINSSMLTLCEVTASGYSYKECPREKTGPGCLLYSCDSEACKAANGTCVSKYCHFATCPEKRHWPPECWIKMPELSNISKVTCNYSSTVNITLPHLEDGQLSSMSTTRIAIKVQDLESKYQHSQSFVYPADYNCSSLFFGNLSWAGKEVVFSPEVCLGNVCHFGPDYVLMLKWNSGQNPVGNYILSVGAMTPAIAGAASGTFVIIGGVAVACVLLKKRRKQTKLFPRAKIVLKRAAQETVSCTDSRAEFNTNSIHSKPVSSEGCSTKTDVLLAGPQMEPQIKGSASEVGRSTDYVNFTGYGRTRCELSTYTSLEQRIPPTYASLEKKLKNADNQVYSSVSN